MNSYESVSSTSKIDALHRALYLRREYALITQSHEFNDVLLIPPQEDADGVGGCWQGLVAIRQYPSPWYRGLFSFLVQLPPKYPFECPIIRMETSLKSHPLLQEDNKGSKCIISFDEVYLGLDPMRVSVMARLLHYVRSLFYPAEWTTLVPINKALARYDVERRSVTQEVVLGKPYVDYLSQEAVAFFTEPNRFSNTTDNNSGGDDIRLDVTESREEWEKDFSLWLGRTWIPTMRLLQ